MRNENHIAVIAGPNNSANTMRTVQQQGRNFCAQMMKGRQSNATSRENKVNCSKLNSVGGALPLKDIT